MRGRWPWWAAALVVVSLAGRAFALWLAGDRIPLGDSFVYPSLAHNLLAGRGLVSDEIKALPGLRAFYPPGYPLLLAAIGLVLPLGAATYAALNTLIDAAASLLVARLGAEAGDRKAGLIAGALYFAWPTNIFLAPFAYKEGLVALLVLGVILALLAAARGEWRGTVGFGLVTGVLVLVQPGLATLAPLLGLALRPQFGKWRPWARSMAVAAAIAIIVLTPWWLRNFLLFDRFIPFTTAGPASLWVGATPLGNGSWVPLPPALLAGGELQAAAALGAEAGRIIAADPIGYIGHCLAKLPLAFSASQQPLQQLLVMQPVAHEALIVRLMWLPQVATAVMLAAAVAGTVRARRGLLARILAAMGVQILLFGLWFEFTARHRYFMTPILLLLAVAAFRRHSSEPTPPPRIAVA